MSFAVHFNQLVSRSKPGVQRQLAFQQIIFGDLFCFQHCDVAITLERTVRQNAFQVFKIDACAVNLRIVGGGHLFNPLALDGALIAGCTFHTDAHPFREQFFLRLFVHNFCPGVG